MLKAINGAHYGDDDPMFAGVREYARSGGADSVIVWGLRWKFYEPKPGQYVEAMWQQLDAQIYNAKCADRRRVYLVVGQEGAPWVTAKQTAALGASTKGRSWRLPPDDLTPDGPWGKYLEKHLLRYPNIDGIIVLNEPNAAFMDHDKPGRVVATMIKSAAQLWYRHNAKPILLTPATLDGPGCLTFTWEVLSGLGRGWRAPAGVRVGWAHHPYTDIKRGLTGPRSQTWRVQQLLRAWRWTGV